MAGCNHSRQEQLGQPISVFEAGKIGDPPTQCTRRQWNQAYVIAHVEFFQGIQVSPCNGIIVQNGALHKICQELADACQASRWSSLSNNILEVDALEIHRGIRWHTAAWATAGLVRDLLSTIGASDKNHVVKLIMLLSQPQAPLLHPPGAGASTSPPCSTWTAGPAHVAIAAVCWASKASARAWACARAWASPSAWVATDAVSAAAERS